MSSNKRFYNRFIVRILFKLRKPCLVHRLEPLLLIPVINKHNTSFLNEPIEFSKYICYVHHDVRYKKNKKTRSGIVNDDNTSRNLSRNLSNNLLLCECRFRWRIKRLYFLYNRFRYSCRRVRANCLKWHHIRSCLKLICAFVY